MEYKDSQTKGTDDIIMRMVFVGVICYIYIWSNNPPVNARKQNASLSCFDWDIPATYYVFLQAFCILLHKRFM